MLPIFTVDSTRAATTGLVAAYPFSEGSGTAVGDASGTGNSGTTSNTTWSAAGKYGGALSFNGTSARVNIPNSSSLQLTTAMTLEAWVNPATVSSVWRDVLYKGNDNYYLEATSSNGSKPDAGLIAGGSYGDAYGTAALSANTWSFLTETYDGATLRLYVNGTQVAATAHTGAITTSTSQLQIGGDSLYGQYFKGLIDEVRVYNTALSAAAIQTDMNTPIAAGGDTTPPSAPGTLSASVVNAGELDLSWGAATDNVGVTGYRVYRCLGAGCTSYALFASPTGTATTYKDTSVAASSSYGYEVRAVDAAGNLGAFSNTVAATTPAPPDAIPPSAPGTLTGTVVGSAEIDLSWGAATDNVGVTGYRVFRCQGAACTNYALLTQPVGTPTTFHDTSVAAGTSYGYEVRAVDAAGNLGAFSNAVSATTQGASDTTPPSLPGTLSSNAVSTGEIDLVWGVATDNVGVASYEIFRCTGAVCGTFAKVGQTGGGTTSFNDSGLTAATSYSYEVRAVDAAGNLGPFSNTTSAVTSQTNSSGLVAAYSFNEGTGTTVADASGNGNVGTISNAAWAASGKYGGALSFNGTNARVNIPNSASLQLSSGMTLEAWVNPSTTTSVWRDVIYKGDDNYYLEASSDNGGKPAVGGTFGGGNANAYGSTPLGANAWSYVAVTYDGATIRLYVNGTMVGSQAKTGAITSSTNQLQIGGDALYGQYFSGLIDEIRIYNTALSAAAIQADMTTPVSGSSTTDTTPPSTPTALTTGAVGQTSITLSWNPSSDNTGVTGYRTYLNGNQVGTSPSTSYGYSNLSCGTSYTLGVAAVDAAGNVSGIATLAKQTAACSDTTPPSAPGTLTGTAAASTEIDLSWGAATDNVGVAGYQIWRCQGAGCTTYSQLTQTTGSTPTYKDLSTAPATTYGYEVRALDAAGNTGAYTNSIQATTPSAPPPAMYSIGGIVSGISGTIVLENNGGDDLTLSANGAFTFATKLPSGAAYSVTVKTSPSGQSCTVSNGSGTVGSTDVSSVVVACSAAGTASGSDDFNRADGGLGAAWVAVSDGGLAISSQVVVGSSAVAGDVRAAETYGADQFSAIQLTSTQLTGGQWVGPAVRVQNSGLDMYLGIYFWNSGSPQLRIYERSAGNWIQLGSSYDSGPLAAGTVLKLASVGSRIALSQNGVERIVVSDNSLSAGQPGIMTFGVASADNWSAGAATVPSSTLQVDYTGTDANGVAQYNVTSPDDGGTQVMRVLAPTNPAPGVPHNFLFVLPVEAGLSTDYGDGLETLRALDAQDQYNLTIIEPSFAIEPWYADNPNDPSVRYETFLTNDLEPWVMQNLAETGAEQKWLIGFSKSGIGATDLILKHPDVFTLAAAWDFPADMSTYDQFGSSSALAYGTNDNFLTNYRLTPAFIDAHRAPFLSKNRIWIGGYNAFQTDMSDFDALLTSEAVLHSTEAPQNVPHRWDSGWVQIALAALRADSANLP